MYAARAELEPVVLTGIELGGQAALTHTIENYPAFRRRGRLGIGRTLPETGRKIRAKVEFDSAQSVDLSKRPTE